MNITINPFGLTLFVCAMLIAIPSDAISKTEVIYEAGQSCSHFGETRLATDGTSILACLATEPGNTKEKLAWKSGHTAVEMKCHTARYHGDSNTLSAMDGFDDGTQLNSVVFAGKFNSVAARLAHFPASAVMNNATSTTAAKCIGDYTRAGCSIATRVDPKNGHHDNDINMANNGCITDDEESRGNPRIFITCCKLETQ